MASGFPVDSSKKDREYDNLRDKCMIAVQFGYVDVLETVSKRLPHFEFNFKLNLGLDGEKKIFTPLLYACKHNQLPVVKWLLQSTGMKKDARTEKKETALMLAISHTDVNVELVQELLTHGEQDLGAKNKHKLTALHIAADRGHMKIVEILLELNNAWTAKGMSPPKTIGRQEMMDKFNNTPFMNAVSKNTPKHREIVKLWLEKEKEPSMILRPVCDDINKKGFNAVMIAAHTGQLNCLQIMKNYHEIADSLADLKTTNGWNIFHCAVASGSLETLEWLLMVMDGLPVIPLKLLNEPNKKGFTPFLLACEYQHSKIVEYLITRFSVDKVVSITAKTKNGMTGLHLAAQHDAVDIVKLLIDTGGIEILEKEEQNGNTVLHIATSKSSIKVEERLKKDPDYKNLNRMRNNADKTAEDLRTVYIPPEIKKRGPESIDAYLNALSKGKTKNHHCNLIVLGEARVGKTSLIKGILDMDFDPDCKSTQGVVLGQIELAENLDISVPESSSEGEEIWQPVNRLERVKEQYCDSVASAIAEKMPLVNESENNDDDDEYFETVSQTQLSSQVIRIIDRITVKPVVKLRPVAKPQGAPRVSFVLSSSSESNQHPENPSPLRDDLSTTPVVTHVVPKPKLEQKPVENPKPQTPKVQNNKTELKPVQSSPPVHNKKIPANRRISADILSHEEGKAILKRVMNPKTKDEHELTFHTIDFAGQPLYRPMHHCFITKRAVYLVVFKLTDMLEFIRTKNKNDPAVHEIRYWLNNIIAHGNSLEDTNKESPRIFLVGTHRHGDPKNNKPKLSDEAIKTFDSHIFEIFVGDIKERRYETSIQINREQTAGCKFIFPIENSLTKSKRSDSGIVVLMKQIRKLRDEVSFLAETIPTSYMKFEQKLLEKKKERENQPLATTRAEVESWAKECGIEEGNGIATVIQFFHDIRVIIDQSSLSSPFSPKPTLSALVTSTVLLSPQWLGNVMKFFVQLDFGKPLDMIKVKILNQYGIIHRDELMRYLSFKIMEGLPIDDYAFANLLEILKSYCLICTLSPLHCKLLELKEKEVSLTEGNYLVPIKLPAAPKLVDKLCLKSDCYIFEFDFQSYLPSEVYIHTLCHFLSMLKDCDGEFDHDSVVLTNSCSKFMNVKLESLPKAHWLIKMDNESQTLVFSVLPLNKKPAQPSRFITAIADLILTRVCQHGNLGYLKFNGGPKVFCSTCKKKVLWPFISSENPVPDMAEITCPCCKVKQMNIDDILHSMIVVRKVASRSSTVYASCGTGINYKFIDHASEILHEHMDGWIQKFVRRLGLREEWKKIVEKEDHTVDRLYDILEAWFKKDPKQHTIEGLKDELKDINVKTELINGVFTKEIFSIETDSSFVHKADCTAMSVFQEYSSRIINSITDPLRLADELWSADLVSLKAKDIALNAHGIGDYEKASHVVDAFQKKLSSDNEAEWKINQLIKFCDIIKKYSMPLAEEMRSKLNQ